MSQSIIMTTGGIESTVATVQAMQNGNKIYLIHFNLGRVQDAMELNAINRFSIMHGIPVKIINFQGIQDMFSGIINPEYLNKDLDIICPDEVSIAPGLIQLSLLFARQAKAENLIVGLTKEQLPLERINFFSLLEQANIFFNPNFHKTKIELPFANYSKSEVIELGVKLQVDFNATWSCYLGGASHCGTCDSCVERKNAFKLSNIPDTTQYIQ